MEKSIPKDQVTIICNKEVLGLLGFMIGQNFDGMIDHYKKTLSLVPGAVEELESIVKQMQGAFLGGSRKN